MDFDSNCGEEDSKDFEDDWQGHRDDTESVAVSSHSDESDDDYDSRLEGLRGKVHPDVFTFLADLSKESKSLKKEIRVVEASSKEKEKRLVALEQRQKGMFQSFEPHRRNSLLETFIKDCVVKILPQGWEGTEDETKLKKYNDAISQISSWARLLLTALLGSNDTDKGKIKPPGLPNNLFDEDADFLRFVKASLYGIKIYIEESTTEDVKSHPNKERNALAHNGAFVVAFYGAKREPNLNSGEGQSTVDVFSVEETEKEVQRLFLASGNRSKVVSEAAMDGKKMDDLIDGIIKALEGHGVAVPAANDTSFKVKVDEVLKKYSKTEYF